MIGLRAGAHFCHAPGMNDDATIKELYEELLKPIFTTFHQEGFVTKPSPQQKQQAEQNFTNGVTMARQARDRAIALLP
jgi:hypothetical protein